MLSKMRYLLLRERLGTCYLLLREGFASAKVLKRMENKEFFGNEKCLCVAKN